MNYVTAYSRPRYLTAMWNSIRLGAARHLPLPDLRRPNRLGDRPHQYAGEGPRADAGAGSVHHTTISGCDRLDSTRGSEFRVAQSHLDGIDRRQQGPVRYLHLFGPDLHHRDLLVSIHIHLHLRRAGGRLIGNGGCRQHPWRRRDPNDDPDHLAPGAARHPRRSDHHISGSDRPVRFARTDRDSRALQRRDHPIATIFQPADPSRGGGCLRGSAASDHRRVVPGAAETGEPPRLRRPDRQRAANGG